MARYTDKEYIDFWEKKRAQGRQRYALLDGLKWSLSTIAIVVFFQIFILDATDKENLYLTIGIESAALLVAGYVIYYYLMWVLYENKYLKLKQNLTENKNNESSVE